MSLDVIKYAIGRISDTDPVLGFPKTATELKGLVGETITPKGIGGEKAFALFRDVLVKASVPIDHPRHLAFVAASPTRAAVMFDLVTSATSVHGAFWLEGAGCIFAENQAMEWLVSLTGMPEGAFGVFTSGGTEANLSAMVAAREYWRSLDKGREFERGVVITSDGAHSSIQRDGESYRRRCHLRRNGRPSRRRPDQRGHRRNVAATIVLGHSRSSRPAARPMPA